MKMRPSFFAARWARQAAVVCLMGAAASSWALEIDGVRFEDRAKVGSAQLQVNGAGVRFAAGGLVRAYAVALYLPNKITHESELRAVRGPKRIHLVTMRDVSSNDFGRAMMKALRANLNVDEQIRHIEGITHMGAIFGVVPQMRKGETLSIEQVPGTGVLISVNGKRVGEVIRDESFFDAMAQIWIGKNPVDTNLKLALLGQAPAKDDPAERMARY